jgi:hypothetical protein
VTELFHRVAEKVRKPLLMHSFCMQHQVIKCASLAANHISVVGGV